MSCRRNVVARRFAAAVAVVFLAACGQSPAPPASAPPPSGAVGAIVALASPAGAGSSEPFLAAGVDGVVTMSWIEPDGEGHSLKYSQLAGDAWSAPRVAARGDDFFVNASDLPAVEHVTGAIWAAHWRTPHSDAPYAYDVKIAISADDGATWSAPQLLNDDGVAAEHGFVSLFAWDGAVGALWLDGRVAEAESEVEVPDQIDLANLPPPPGTQLRYAHFAADARVLEQGIIDELVCDCCRTGVATANGALVVVYRDRTAQEIRDIFVRRQTAAGWGDAVSVGADGWEIEGCPVNGPAITARGAELAVAWFTAANNEARVRFARSGDGGATFAPPIDVDADGVIGQVGVVLADDGAALVSWWRRAAGGAELSVRRIAATGELGPIRVVAMSTSSRPDTVPQMARAGGRVVFAWTDEAADTAVKTAYSAL